jgi:putative NADPH-quinone reductase
MVMMSWGVDDMIYLCPHAYPQCQCVNKYFHVIHIYLLCSTVYLMDDSHQNKHSTLQLTTNATEYQYQKTGQTSTGVVNLVGKCHVQYTGSVTAMQPEWHHAQLASFLIPQSSV